MPDAPAPRAAGPAASSAGALAVLTAMDTELGPLARKLALRRGSLGGVDVRTGTAGPTLTPVVAAVIGVGPAMARRTLERLLDAVPVSRVLLIGVSGGVAATLRIGAVMAPAVVEDRQSGRRFVPDHPAGVVAAGTLLTCDTLAVGEGTLTAYQDRGIDAVDMETAAVAAVCEERGIPWSVFRAISDRLVDDLVDDTILGLTRPDGSTNLGAVARLVLRHPGDVRRLARLGRETNRALSALTRTALGVTGGRTGA